MSLVQQPFQDIDAIIVFLRIIDKLILSVTVSTGVMRDSRCTHVSRS